MPAPEKLRVLVADDKLEMAEMLADGADLGEDGRGPKGRRGGHRFDALNSVKQARLCGRAPLEDDNEQRRREEDSEAGGNDDVEHGYTLIWTIFRMTRMPRSINTTPAINRC